MGAILMHPSERNPFLQTPVALLSEFFVGERFKEVGQHQERRLRARSALSWGCWLGAPCGSQTYVASPTPFVHASWVAA